MFGLGLLKNFKTSGSGRLRAVGFFKLRARVPSGWPKSGLNGSGFRARATLTHHYLTKRLVPALVLSNFISSSERLLCSLSVIFWQKMSDTSINLPKDYLLKELFLNKLEMLSRTEGPKKIMVIVQNLIV